ncbi:uncharacterized protein LODBEIA_P01510 [Lodderomyces beijingensis]|uniref:Transmembrane protein 135 N-terminal domain-containing protein n=1 Tax=Lodderomyces beijingensis TaxID=1775926 RepID=A0ABP0ZIC9_9ASCO
MPIKATVPIRIAVQILQAVIARYRGIFVVFVTRVVRSILYLWRKGSKGVYYAFKLIFFQRSLVFTFAIAYIYEVVPKLLKKTLSHFYRFKFDTLHEDLASILVSPFSSDNLAIFLARLVATMNALNPLFVKMLAPLVQEKQVRFASTFMAGLTAALLNFPNFQEERIQKDRFYTFDWTLILATKAIDSVMSTVFSRIIDLPPGTSGFSDLVLCTVAVYLLMDAWFYNPEKLNPSYLKWLNKMSNIDADVLQGMRYLRDGSLNYGPASAGLPNQHHFENVARKYGKDASLGDLTIHDKLPCEVLHQFRSKSCVKHAAYTFFSQFATAFKFYGSVNLFVYTMVKKFYGNPCKIFLRTIRSSLSLTSLSTLHWCCICAVRNYHPHIYDQRFWDVMGPKIGAAVASFGIAFESAIRRSDLLTVIAPKALGTLLDSTPSEKNLWMETIVFSVSFAILVAYARSNPARLRGLIGKGFGYLIK